MVKRTGRMKISDPEGNVKRCKGQPAYRAPQIQWASLLFFGRDSDHDDIEPTPADVRVHSLINRVRSHSPCAMSTPSRGAWYKENKRTCEHTESAVSVRLAHE